VTAALLMSSCGSDEDDAAGTNGKTEQEADAPLKVEATEGPRGTELIVYVVDEAKNTPAAAGGKRRITLRCFDTAREVLVNKRHPWPFTDTDSGVTDAHVHQPVARSRANEVSRCELDGTRGPLSGEVTTTGFE
jgi:hypothetical protein